MTHVRPVIARSAATKRPGALSGSSGPVGLATRAVFAGAAGLLAATGGIAKAGEILGVLDPRTGILVPRAETTMAPAAAAAPITRLGAFKLTSHVTRETHGHRRHRDDRSQVHQRRDDRRAARSLRRRRVAHIVHALLLVRPVRGRDGQRELRYQCQRRRRELLRLQSGHRRPAAEERRLDHPGSRRRLVGEENSRHPGPDRLLQAGCNVLEASSGSGFTIEGTLNLVFDLDAVHVESVSVECIALIDYYFVLLHGDRVYAGSNTVRQFFPTYHLARKNFLGTLDIDFALDGNAKDLSGYDAHITVECTFLHMNTQVFSGTYDIPLDVGGNAIGIGGIMNGEAFSDH